MQPLRARPLHTPHSHDSEMQTPRLLHPDSLLPQPFPMQPRSRPRSKFPSSLRPIFFSATSATGPHRLHRAPLSCSTSVGPPASPRSPLRPNQALTGSLLPPLRPTPRSYCISHTLVHIKELYNKIDLHTKRGRHTASSSSPPRAAPVTVPLFSSPFFLFPFLSPKALPSAD